MKAIRVKFTATKEQLLAAFAQSKADRHTLMNYLSRAERGDDVSPDDARQAKNAGIRLLHIDEADEMKLQDVGQKVERMEGKGEP